MMKSKIKNIENKMLDITNLATNTTPNAKINKVKNEIPSITSLATTAALTTVENRMPNVSYIVTTADYDAKILEIQKKYFTISD